MTNFRSILSATLVFAAVAVPVAAEAAPPTQTVLFIGNSFTFAARSPAWHYRASTVDDLNGTNVGGVPALFKLFAEESGLDYAVSVETDSGQTFGFHYAKRRSKIDQRWDHVLMQQYSTLDPKHPGDDRSTKRDAKRLAQLFAHQNPNVDVRLVATWSRPDLTYRTPSPWYGKPIDAMETDLGNAYAAAAATDPHIHAVVPVGAAFNRAIETGIADPDPFDGVAAGTIDLWSDDNYHASKYGYYLEALMDFGSVTGIDPRRLGQDEQAAHDLSIAPDTAAALQQVAATQLAMRTNGQ